MTYQYAKTTKILTSSIAVLMMFSGMSFAFADNPSDFVSVNADRIKNDPVLAKILENIEKSKQEFSDIQDKTIQENLVNDQRAIAKKILEQELEQMFEDNKDFTSLAAFNNFLKTVSNDNTRTVFQGLFDYQQNKIESARTVMSDVLKNGGSLQAARDAYHDALQIPRSDMIRLVNDLNTQSGFSDPTIQDHFDNDGKLPRYDDEQESIISFVGLTSSSRNINSSPIETNNTETNNTETNNTETNNTENVQNNSSSNTSENTLIQKLLDEIKSLKNKIAELEKRENPVVHQAVFQQNDDKPVHFAAGVVEYSQGLGNGNGLVKDVVSIPVKALNAPDSHDTADNSLALGRTGHVILSFSESVSDELVVYEASVEPTLRELASVEVSADGKNWTLLTHTQYDHSSFRIHEFGYDLSDVGCIKYVKITDNAPSRWGDGFDVDAIGATKLCSSTS